MRLPILVVALALSGCASEPRIREYIDNDTAVTVTTANAGWVFARERPDLAIHAQDYLTVTPVQINRGGKRITYLYCHLWSTIDRRIDKSIVPPKAELALVADDRRIPLPNTPTDIRAVGLGHEPVTMPNKSAEVRMVAVDADLIRYIAVADQVRISVSTDGVAEYYLSWRDNRRAFLDLAQRIDVHR